VRPSRGGNLQWYYCVGCQLSSTGWRPVGHFSASAMSMRGQDDGRALRFYSCIKRCNSRGCYVQAGGGLIQEDDLGLWVCERRAAGAAERSRVHRIGCPLFLPIPVVSAGRSGGLHRGRAEEFYCLTGVIVFGMPADCSCTRCVSVLRHPPGVKPGHPNLPASARAAPRRFEELVFPAPFGPSSRKFRVLKLN